MPCCGRRHRIQHSFRSRACRLLLTGVISVSGINDAKYVVRGRLLLLVPILVDKPGGAAPLPQFGENFSLQNAKTDGGSVSRLAS